MRLAQLRAMLETSTSRQIGDLGEETAAVHLETARGATIVALGDAGMPRTHGRQDLDIVAVLDDELIAFEVKTAYHGRHAGSLTAAGNLRRPRLRSARTPRRDGLPTSRQGSQSYAAARLSSLFDVDDEFPGVAFRLIAVDLRLLHCQEFALDDAGRARQPIGEPTDCSAAALIALGRILRHRGSL